MPHGPVDQSQIHGRFSGGLSIRIHLWTNGDGLPEAAEFLGGDFLDYEAHGPLMHVECGCESNAL